MSFKILNGDKAKALKLAMVMLQNHQSFKVIYVPGSSWVSWNNGDNVKLTTNNRIKNHELNSF